MRRVCSILAILTVLCPMASPLWASAIQKAHLASCHRLPMANNGVQRASHPAHHCHDMDADESQAPADTNPSLVSGSSSEKCPMNCCLQAAPPTVAALPAASFLPLPVATRTQVSFLPVTFTSAGFSSHTDRGPPGA